MENSVVTGRISSIQSLGTVDGPGVRFVVFMQGCPLRCGCCHNPETQGMEGGTEYTPKEIAERAEKYKEYFGSKGGITVSGGEPLLQAEFVAELFKECRKKGINTCLDTSGCILNDSVKELLKYTDLVLLDIKYTEQEQYRNFVGCEMSAPLRFLEYLNGIEKATVIRQVVIPTLNDNSENILRLAEIVKKYPCIEKTELLPFKKLCEEKYSGLKRDFPFAHLPEPTEQKMADLWERFNLEIK
ncbi:MAG: pyruvate formate lyase-activating protein [Clostridia bacterium]|nr:pyruvate formate lyase-activating protein [Clostridia bacterium]